MQPDLERDVTPAAPMFYGADCSSTHFEFGSNFTLGPRVRVDGRPLVQR